MQKISLWFGACALLFPLSLAACAPAAQDGHAPAASATAFAAETPAAATPSPTPSPEPEMMIEEDGDIVLRSDIAASFSAQTYAFDRAPVVLIYHTHATEAYLKGETDDYAETEEGRTEDGRYSVVSVGNALADALTDAGFTVLHDATNVEKPDLLSAYSRSLAVMRQYENVDIYIDLHRNAAATKGPPEKTRLVGKDPAARLFFVVGTGIGTYDGEYDALPDWESNYTFALSVCGALEKEAPGLVRPIRLKVGRFNQHMGLCLLAEIGTNADTLAAAKNTAPLLAAALKEICIF